MTRAELTRKVRQVPLVFRISGALLMVALVGGQFLQRQPAGPSTRGVIAYAARSCPSAAFTGKHTMVVRGARALDRRYIGA